MRTYYIVRKVGRLLHLNQYIREHITNEKVQNHIQRCPSNEKNRTFLVNFEIDFVLFTNDFMHTITYRNTLFLQCTDTL